MTQLDLKAIDALLTSDTEADLASLRGLVEACDLADSVFVSPEEARRQVDAMLTQPLSVDLLEWVLAYNEVGLRDAYLWQWCREAVEITTLSSVLPAHRDHVCDTKTLGVMFDVLLDDVADRNGDAELLEELNLLPFERSRPDFSRLAPDVQAYADFTARLWQEIQQRARQYPCYDEYADLLRYDYLQLCNVMRYSLLLNSRLDLLNLAEHDLYTPHNMHIMICSTFDLMCSPQFDRTELGRLREVIWHAQWMGRIGNLITTWQRELAEGDFTSGIYARAVTCGDLTVAQLREAGRGFIKQAIDAGGHERYFLGQWLEHRRHLLQQGRLIRSVDVTELAKGLGKLISLHLACRGRK